MKHLIVILFALSLFASTAVRAEVFVWKDPIYDIKVTFPDNWMQQARLDDDLRLFILAPQGADHAACRLYASHDGRYMDATAEEGSAVTSKVFDVGAIQREMFERPDTNNVRISSYNSAGSLGSGAAALVHLEFQKEWLGRSYAMHAQVLATQYHGDRIFMSCETLFGGWAYWEPTIQAIFKSVSFPPAFTPTVNSLYRPFQNEGQVYLPVNRRIDGITTR